MVLKRYWPAVSQICILIFLPSTSIVLILKSIPEMRGKSTNGGEMGGHEVVLAEPQQDVRFAHPTVPDYQQLRKIVIILVFSHLYIYIL